MGSSLAKGVALFCTNREAERGLPEVCVAVRRKLTVYAHNGAQYSATQARRSRQPPILVVQKSYP